MRALAAAALLGAVAVVGFFAWPVALAGGVLLGTGLAVAALCAGLWWRGTMRASQALGLIDAEARKLKFVRCDQLPDAPGNKCPQPSSA
jgi:hypothetical protein